MKLTSKQRKAISLLTDNQTDYIGYGGAAGGGKSVLGCRWLMELGFYCGGAKFFIGRDSLKDTRGSVLYTFGEVASKLGFSNYRFTDYGIELGNGTVIELLDLSFYPYKDPLYDRLGSKEYTCGWIEEAQQTHYLAFEILKTRVGRWKNKEFNVIPKILCTFNPKKNWVDTTFYRPFEKGQETKETRFVFALPTDNPHLPAEYIERLKNLKDKSTRERLLKGNFNYDDDPELMISYDQIQSIWTNTYAKTGTKYIISDVARYGSDKAIIQVWDGWKLIEMHSFDVSKTTDIQNCINAQRNKHKVQLKNIIVDDDGIGGGVVDTLNCTGFVNNSKPRNESYKSLKDECGYKLAEMIDEIFVECEVGQDVRDRIEQELGQLKTYQSDRDSKLRILPKEKIKENIGRSPDYLDCFIMRMLPELKINKLVPLYFDKRIKML